MTNPVDLDTQAMVLTSYRNLDRFKNTRWVLGNLHRVAVALVDSVLTDSGIDPRLLTVADKFNAAERAFPTVKAMFVEVAKLRCFTDAADCPEPFDPADRNEVTQRVGLVGDLLDFARWVRKGQPEHGEAYRR